MNVHHLDEAHMARALALAARGQGLVEPNPMVGSVVARGDQVVGEGWHRKFGGPHAEIEALREAGDRARGATLYVTLEPCCHHGKTPPCTEAILASGVARVVAAMRDPFPEVSGRGLAQLEQAGLDVSVGICETQARRLNAPYLKLVQTGRPWVIAKWAMTLDGKLASHTGDSRWISSEASRQKVHELRGRVDAILVGRGTAQQDDPMLTARPEGLRTAARVVLDRSAGLPITSRLVQSAHEAPVIVVAGPEAPAEACQRLREAGCEVLVFPGATREQQLLELMNEMGRRRMTNVLVEGGGAVLGALFDARLVDEVHVFIAPKIIGGASALTPVAGRGHELMSQALSLTDVQWEQVENDCYLRGRVQST